MDFYLKVHRTGGEILVAACDKEILGKTLSDGDIEIKVNSSFYGLELCSKETLSQALKECSLANLLGDKVVEHAIGKGLIDKKNVCIVGGVKHAQIVCF